MTDLLSYVFLAYKKNIKSSAGTKFYWKGPWQKFLHRLKNKSFYTVVRNNDTCVITSITYRLFPTIILTNPKMILGYVITNVTSRTYTIDYFLSEMYLQ